MREGPLPSSLVKERLFALVAGATAIIEAATRDPSNRGAHLPEARKRRNLALHRFRERLALAPTPQGDPTLDYNSLIS